MRLLYIGWGEHIHVTRWAEQFATRGEDVTVLSVSTKGHYQGKVRQILHRFKGRRLSIQRLWVRLVFAFVRPQIVHVQWLNFLTFVPSSYKGRLVATSWGSDLYQEQALRPEAVRALEENLKRVDWFTADSRDQCDLMIARFGVDPARVDVVQWGVDRRVFPAGPAFTARPNDIYSCRNLAPIYNQDLIVRAFARVRERVPDARLILKTHRAEDPPYSLVMDLIGELGLRDAVEILPSLPYDELPRLYQRAKVTVSAATTDGTPATGLEAMACGSIPVFSDVPSLREWIVDGENGYLCDPRDVDQIAEKMLLALTLDATTANGMQRRNLAMIEEKADHDTHMEAVHRRYRELLHDA